MLETPISTRDGISGRRDRRWGWVGGVVGLAVGLGSAAIAVYIEGANALESSPYPPFFTTRRLLAYDVFLAAMVAVGALFLIAAIMLAKRSRFPRTDAAGGTIIGLVLMSLGAALLFSRLAAVIRGA